MIMLRAIVDSVYEDSTYKPKVLGPGGFFDKQWFDEFLQSSGPNIVDGVTHHIYNLGPGDAPDLLQKIQDPVYLSEVAQTFKDAQTSVSQYGMWSAPWIGESGGAYNSGGKYVSHTFVDSFWYLDQLGMTSTFDHKVYCRQSLIGGNYGLLNTTSFIPNPDYYSALLWHRLMGTSVLSTTHEGSPYLRTYSHCSKQKPGVTLLLINLSNSTSFNITVENDMNLYPDKMTRFDQMMLQTSGLREEYHLTPNDGNVQSDVVLLNGSPLELTCDGDIPDLVPEIVDGSLPIQMAPSSIAFINIKDFQAPACA
ncbi:Heparanase-like protein 1 [Acorus calamus]|uniref:Heparanase-like protein 1 n=1 Tax=Acorus calamus TaxID=4465 RepID=A0AAV9E0C2_ACOCL|nr:Heparanase-like protein 1 [Acorus calamus]